MDPQEAQRRIMVGIKLSDLAHDQAEWSQKTFGRDDERGPVGALRHLAREAAEAEDSLDDPLEYADCLLLTIDAARRAGFGIEQLLTAAQEKMEINKKRKWPKPVDDNPVEHIRD